jgi:hypothetical protein
VDDAKDLDNSTTDDIFIQLQFGKNDNAIGDTSQRTTYIHTYTRTYIHKTYTRTNIHKNIHTQEKRTRTASQLSPQPQPSASALSLSPQSKWSQARQVDRPTHNIHTQDIHKNKHTQEKRTRTASQLSPQPSASALSLSPQSKLSQARQTGRLSSGRKKRASGQTGQHTRYILHKRTASQLSLSP